MSLFGGASTASTGFGAKKGGFSFGGGTTTTSAPTGFGFGNTATTSASTGFGASTGFNFGGTGTTTTSASTGFGASTGFNFGGTGTTTTSASTGFGFGSTAPTTSTGGGGLFGGGGFNQPAATSASTGFGFGGGLGTSTGFGTNTSTTGFGTGGTGFGQGGTGFGTGGTGFGAGTNTGFGGLGGGLGQQQQGAGAAPQSSNEALTQMAAAVSGPMIFGDERDTVLAKWNQLQAFWGTGKGVYDKSGMVAFGPDNPFCRFKAVGYNCLPVTKNADGLVAMTFRQRKSQVEGAQQKIIDTLARMMCAGKQNMTVHIESIRELPDDCTEVVVYIQERQVTGATKRFPATEVLSFLSQNTQKEQLKSQLGVTDLIPKTGMQKDQLKQYLDNPPQGIHPLIWEQAKLENPDPEKLLPVPIVGFSELHTRLKHLDMQTLVHNASLTMITNEIASLQRKQSDIVSKTEECKRNHLKLSHRVLKLIGKQEVYRKMGLGIDEDEEQLRAQLENIQVELNAPTQFKGRLNELMAQIRLRNPLGSAKLSQASGYQIDPALQAEICTHLKQQQEGIQHLINIVKEDLEGLKLIEGGLSTGSSRR